MYDLAVIGSGPGGYVAAIRAAQLGLKTICIEKSETLGGTCLNVGCIPSKALLQTTEYYSFLKNEGAALGIDASTLSLDFNQMMQRKKGVVKSHTDGVQGLFKKNNIETLFGKARLLSNQLIEVGSQKVEAKSILLATGSEPIALPFLPFDETKILSSTGALALSKIPEKMLVIGAGVIGVELASVYARLGSKVTLVEMLDHICGDLDANIHTHFLRILSKQGLEFHLGAAVKRGEVGDKVRLQVQKGDQELNLEADVALVAVGRRPYSTGLGLEELGVKKTAKGHVLVDDNFHTSLANVYAIGDLIEGMMLAHRASDEGIAVAELIAGHAHKIDYVTIPNIIYTHPELAVVGFSEKEAQQAGLEVKTGICFLKSNPRARCAGDMEGLVKVIAEKESGKLLGVHILSAHASELIGEGVVALRSRMTLDELANTSHGHPTLSESIKEACLVALGRPINI